MADANRLVEFASERLGRLDFLVANAASGITTEFPSKDRLTESDRDEMVRVNLKGVYAVVHRAIPHMIAQGGGRIVAVGSVAGQRGTPVHAHYAATKGDVISLVKALAGELARYNILVNCVAPGFVDTDIWKAAEKDKGKLKSWLAQYPLNRVARPEEGAGPILFAAWDLATFVTVEVINVNGGFFWCE